MQIQRETFKSISIIYYAAGILLAMLLSAGAAGADFEASRFNVTTAPRFSGSLTPFDFTCPVAITASEAGMVRARIHNPEDRPRSYTVRANISNDRLAGSTQSEEIVAMAAGEARSFQWPISPENVAWGRIIMARVSVPSSFSIPSRTNTCGILFINVPLIPGGVLVGVYVAITLVTIISGLAAVIFLCQPLVQPQRKTIEGLIALAVVMIASLTFSLIGLWKAGGALLGVAILIAISVTGWALDQKRVEEARKEALKGS